jgi:hypothetical protein
LVFCAKGLYLKAVYEAFVSWGHKTGSMVHEVLTNLADRVDGEIKSGGWI